ncbi:MAG: LacI family DNA-binding transcriptional regulator [Roseiarcus sp.]|jgi:LacI family gluconate utilization system Gnt-I transcriptional repressor
MAPARRRRGGKRGITLAEVARLSGVSEITVSRVLRNKGAIADDTRKKVLLAVDQIGYVPNRVAGTLASATSNLIGVVIPSLANIVFPDVLRGVHAALDASGIQAVVGVTEYDLTTEERLVRSLLAWKPHAMLVVGLDHTEATRRMLLGAGVRVVEMMDIDSTPIDIAVGMSHRNAGFDAGVHLLEHGYRRFGYVGHDWLRDRRARLRFDGLVAALRQAGLNFVDIALHDGPSSTMAGRQTLATLLARAPSIDVAVFSNDDMAVGGVFHCLAEDIAVKERLAIFGFNGLSIGAALPLPLSTIRSHRFEIGKTAARMVLDNEGSRGEPTIVDIGYEIVRGATA